MTDKKTSFRFKLFLIISTVLLALGMALGTVGHFVWNGFFNYGDEFSPYKSVVVRYSAAEYTEDMVKPVCEEALDGLGSYSFSSSESLSGGELVYKFDVTANSEELGKAAEKINSALNKLTGDGLAPFNVASVREGEIGAGGSRSLVFASIAVSSAAAFMFLYYIIRYKLRAACMALLTCIHNLGLFVALIAMTRLPVGAELIAISALIVLLTMACCGVFFDRTRKNFANESNAKKERSEVIADSARESLKLNAGAIIAVVVFALVFGVFAALAAMNISSFLITPIIIIGCAACCYGVVLFAPTVYVYVDRLFEKIKTARKTKKAENKSKSAIDEKAKA